MRSLVKEGICEIVGRTHSSRWQMAGAAPVKRAKKTARVPKPKHTNGAAIVVDESPTSPVKDALLALKEALIREHQEKLAALEILLKVRPVARRPQRVPQ